MTTQQHPAQFDWATELLDAQGHVTLSAKEAHEIGARLRSMGEKLKTYEDLDEAASDVQLLRMGYAAALLEIESLQARIKTMAEERSDELTVAHLDGRMRAAQPAGEYPTLPEPFCNAHSDADSEWPDMFSADQMRAYVDADRAMRVAQVMPESIRSILVRCRNFIDTTKVPAYPAGADLADEIDDVLLAAQPAGALQPEDERASHGQAPAPAQAAPQPSPTPQADSQPAPANTRQIAECYGDCPTDPKTCANPCKFEGRAARAPADSQSAPDALCRIFLVTEHHAKDGKTVPVYGSSLRKVLSGHTTREAAERARTEAEDAYNALYPGYKQCGNPLPKAWVIQEVDVIPPSPTAQADSVLEDAAQVEIDLFNDLNRIYGNTLTAYAKEMCRLGYRKTNAARKQGANHD